MEVLIVGNPSVKTMNIITTKVLENWKKLTKKKTGAIGVIK